MCWWADVGRAASASTTSSPATASSGSARSPTRSTYYRGYKYSETVEVAVVLCRLGYRVRNDILVPVPVFRSRTRMYDVFIDLGAIPLAAVPCHDAPPPGTVPSLVPPRRQRPPSGVAHGALAGCPLSVHRPQHESR